MLQCLGKTFLNQIIGRLFEQPRPTKIIFNNLARRFARAKTGNAELLRQLACSLFKAFLHLLRLELNTQCNLAFW